MDNNVLKFDLSTSDYEKNFWNAMRGQNVLDKIESGYVRNLSTYLLPALASKKVESEIDNQSVMRSICTVVDFENAHGVVTTSEFDDMAKFLEELEAYPVSELDDDFSRINVGYHKMGSIIRVSADLAQDTRFNLEEYLTKRIARVFARTEDDAFIYGNLESEPKGLLGDNGADVGVSSSALSFDDVISLYFSVKPEYRAKGTWLMNDATALALRKLKDRDGNYLWRDSDDTILGHKVVISEFMPDAESGKCPIAFGDFSYYWIIKRSDITIKHLVEKYILRDQKGYSVYRFIEGLLVKPDAIKLLEMS